MAVLKENNWFVHYIRWRNFALPRCEPGSPKWHSGALSTTPLAHTLEGACLKKSYFYLHIFNVMKRFCRPLKNCSCEANYLV
jgi:hypothetical protein